MAQHAYQSHSSLQYLEKFFANLAQSEENLCSGNHSFSHEVCNNSFKNDPSIIYLLRPKPE